MKLHPRQSTGLLLALVLFSGGLLLGKRFLPVAAHTNPLAMSPGIAVSSKSLPQSNEDEEYQTEINALFGPVRRQMRAARKMPDLDALLAIAKTDNLNPPIPGLGDGDGPLTKAVDAMTPTQRLWAFQRLLLNQSNSADRESALSAVFGSLLTHPIAGQPEAIARWLLEQENRFPDPRETHEYASEEITEWSRTDGLAAANFAVRLALDGDDSSTLPRVLLSVCSIWANNDPHGALVWAKALPDTDTHKVYALEGVFSSFRAFDPDETKACVIQLLGVNKDAPELAAQVAGRLARVQISEPDGPLATAQWVASLPGRPLYHEALQQVTDVWVMSCPDKWPQAVQWANSLPANEARGSVWGTMAISWEGFDTVSLARGSSEFFERLKINENAANEWFNRLPVGADRDEAITMRDQWLASIRNQKIWR